jgi:hypothetical protein
MPKISRASCAAVSCAEYFHRLTQCVVLICAVVVLSGCTVPVTCALYNNTSTVINITQIDINGQERTFSLKAGEILKLGGWPLHNYKILFKDVVWHYDPPVPNNDYVEISGFGPWVKPIVYAQIEKDGRIFLLLKNQKPPIDTMPMQPEGYPLLPKVQ